MQLTEAIKFTLLLAIIIILGAYFFAYLAGKVGNKNISCPHCLNESNAPGASGWFLCKSCSKQFFYIYGKPTPKANITVLISFLIFPLLGIAFAFFDRSFYLLIGTFFPTTGLVYSYFKNISFPIKST